MSIADMKEVQPLLMEMMAAFGTNPGKIAEHGLTPTNTLEWERGVLEAQLMAVERSAMIPLEVKEKAAQISHRLALGAAKAAGETAAAAAASMTAATLAQTDLATTQLKTADQIADLQQATQLKEGSRALIDRDSSLKFKEQSLAADAKEIRLEARKEALRIKAAAIQLNERKHASRDFVREVRPYLVGLALVLVALTVYSNIYVDGGRSAPVFNQFNGLWDWFWMPISDRIHGK